MATVIDKLLVEIGLDAKDLKTGMDASIKKLKESEKVIDRTAKKNKKNQKESTKELKGQNKELTEMNKNLTNLGKGFIAYSTVAKTINIFKDLTDDSARIERLSKSLNLSASQTKSFSNMLANVGGNGAEAIQTIKGINDAISSLQFAGETGGMMPWLARLGVSLTDANGVRKSAKQLLEDIRNGLNKLGDPNEKNYIAERLGFTPDFIFLMGKTDEEWKKLNKDAEDQAAVMDKVAKQTERATEAYNKLKTSLESVGLDVVGKILGTGTAEETLQKMENFPTTYEGAKEVLSKGGAEANKYLTNGPTVGDYKKAVENKAESFLKGKHKSAAGTLLKNGGNFLSEKLHGLISAASNEWNVDKAILTKLISTESAGKTGAVSGKGAAGVAQFMPSTAKAYGVDVTSDQSSVSGAGHYLHDLLNMFGGDYKKALAGYNWGQGNVQKAVKKYGSDWLSHAPAETQDYVRKIHGSDFQLSPNMPAEKYGNGATVNIDNVTINTQSNDPKGIKNEFTGKMSAYAEGAMR